MQGARKLDEKKQPMRAIKQLRAKSREKRKMMWTGNLL